MMQVCTSWYLGCLGADFVIWAFKNWPFCVCWYIVLLLRRERREEQADKIVCREQLSKSSGQMVKLQWIIFNCQTDQSQMSSIGSPTPLSGPKTDDGIIKLWLWWVDYHYTWRENEGIQITQSTNGNLAEQILLNPQSLPNRARTSNSKVAIVFLKEKNGALSTTKFQRDLLPQRLNAVVELCISLCLTSYNWTCTHWHLLTRKMCQIA
jgi:hypothetical protein